LDYIEQNLITGETVRYRTGLHWIVLLWPCGFGALVGLMGLGLLSGGLFAKNGGEFVVSGLAVAFIGAGLCGLGWLFRSSAEFAITNKRVILKRGILKRRTAEMFLNKIESIGVDQSLVGRMLGYGIITVRGTGGTFEPFDTVSHPLEFRRQVQEQIDRGAKSASAASV